MGEVTGTVLRTNIKPVDQYGKASIGIYLDVPGRGPEWWNCWDDRKVAGIEEGKAYTFVTEKRVSKKTDEVYENITGFAEDEDEDKWERTARQVDRQTGKPKPAQTHVPPANRTSYRYTKEAVEAERDSIERQLALKVTNEYYAIADRPTFANFVETYGKMLKLLQDRLPVSHKSPPEAPESPVEAWEELDPTPESRIDIPMPVTVRGKKGFAAAVKIAFPGFDLATMPKLLGMPWTAWVTYHNEDERLACLEAWKLIQEADHYRNLV